jgi:hypothetical protein
MNTNAFKQFLKGQTVHRSTKLVALAVSSCMLVAMIAIDASASASASPTLTAHAEAKAQADLVLADWRSVARELRESELGKNVGQPVAGATVIGDATTSPTTIPATPTTIAATPTTIAATPTTVATGGGTAPTGGGTAPTGGGTAPTGGGTTPTGGGTTSPTTTTTAPPAPSSSAGLIAAGPSRSECLVASNPGNTLSALQTSINRFQNSTNSTVTCLGVYTDGSLTWTDWSDPWIAGGSGAAYQSWVGQSPQTRQLVVEVDLIPQSLQTDVNNPLSWETACAAGDYNSYAAALGTNLVSAGLQNSVIRLGSEANGTWEGDFVGNTTQEQSAWASCFDNEVTALRQATGEHFLIDWNPNACTENIPYANYYPGNAYVDIMGLDFYDVDCDLPTTAVSYAQLSNEDDGFSTFEAFANAKGKPMSFPEWGLTTSPAGDDPAYINGVASTVNNGDFAFQEYFDTGSGSSEPIDSGSTPLSATAYGRAFG